MNFRYSQISKQYLLILLAASIILVAFVNPFSLYFLNDDFVSLPLDGRGELFHGRGVRLFAELSFFLDYQMHHSRAWGYILTNLLIHIACCWFGWSWIRKVAGSFGVKLSEELLLAAILLFMWFAFHSETVFWTISRTASIGLLCFLTSWLCFLRSVENRYWLLPAFALILCGLFTYETTLLMPLQLLAWQYLLPQGSDGRKKAPYMLFTSMAAIVLYLPVRKYLTLEWVGSYEAHQVYAFNIPGLVKNFLALICRTLVPPMQDKILGVGIALGILLLLAIVSAWLVARKRVDRWWIFLLINWLMSYGLFVSLGIDLSGYESERYLYIPSFFFSAWIVYTFFLLDSRPVARYMLSGCLIAYHLVFFYVALLHYRKAGELAARIIDTVNETIMKENPDRIVIANLPDKAFGIPVFRFNLNPALQWLHPGTDTSLVQTESRLITANGNDPLFCRIRMDSAKSTLYIRFFPEQKNK